MGKRNKFWLFILSVCFITLPVGLLAEDNQEEDGGLKLVSETRLCSADMTLREEVMKGYDLTKEDTALPDDKRRELEEARKEDRKRRVIGMGEIVVLKLEGKQQVIGDHKQLEWSLINGSEVAELGPKNKNTILLTAKKELTSGGRVEVQVTTVTGEVRSINFEVILPNGISGKHMLKRKNVSGPGKHDPDYIEGAGRRGVSTAPKDYDYNAGASAMLELTILPTTVNFENLKTLEKDKGTVPSLTEEQYNSLNPSVRPYPRQALTHEPNLVGVPILPGNRIFDEVAIHSNPAAISNEISQTVYGFFAWHWKCEWGIVTNSISYYLPLVEVHQSFYLSLLGKAYNTPDSWYRTYASITKFEKRVERYNDPVAWSEQNNGGNPGGTGNLTPNKHHYE